LWAADAAAQLASLIVLDFPVDAHRGQFLRIGADDGQTAIRPTRLDVDLRVLAVFLAPYPHDPRPSRRLQLFADGGNVRLGVLALVFERKRPDVDALQACHQLPEPGL